MLACISWLLNCLIYFLIKFSSMELSTDQLITICIWFLTFYILFYIIIFNNVKVPKRLNELKDKEYSKQDYHYYFIEYISAAHAWSSIILGGSSIYLYGTRPTDRTVASEYIVMMNSLAYLSFDLVLELYLNIWDFENFLHHIWGIFPTMLVLYYDYGGSSIVAFTFYGELTNPWYLRKCHYKRIGMENSITHQVWLWIYAALFTFCRGYLFIFIWKDAMEFPHAPIILKFFACLFVFISQGWLVFLFGMLWKSLPIWFSDPNRIRNTTWWLTVREAYTKLTRKNPGYAVTLSIVTTVSFLMPFSYGLYHSFKN